MIEVLKKIVPRFSHIQEYEIKNSFGLTVGFQSTLVTDDNFAFAGGTANDLNLARRICFSEAIERVYFFKSLTSSALSSSLFLDKYPTTCGFAAGFNKEKTIFRAICEAVERWAWSKWIDKKFTISQVKPILNTRLSKHYLECFDEVIFLQSPIKLNSHLVPEYISKNLVWSVALGIKGNGIFPGSRVTTSLDEVWEHPLLEAWRHKLIYENELKNAECKDIFEERIKYFGENKEEALKQCAPFVAINFPEAKLNLMTSVKIEKFDSEISYFVYRALCEDYIGWEHGNESRFVY